MLKIAGVFFVFLASSSFGFYKANEIIKRIEQMKIMKKIIIMLKGEITYALAPLDEAFFQIKERVQPPFSQFFEGLYDEMSKNQTKDFRIIWETKVDTMLSSLLFKKEDFEQLKRVGSHLGYLDKEMQLSNLELYLHHLDGEIDAAKGNVEKQVKMFRYLGVMGGLFVIIILI